MKWIKNIFNYLQSSVFIFILNIYTLLFPVYILILNIVLPVTTGKADIVLLLPLMTYCHLEPCLLVLIILDLLKIKLPDKLSNNIIYKILCPISFVCTLIFITCIILFALNF